MNRITVFALLLVVSLGCSFSHSSKSSSNSSTTSSDSSSNSSNSSSGSSGGDEAEEQAFRDDVRDYTQASLLAAGGFTGLHFAAFQKGLSAIARRHGIANWEVRPSTWRGIGAGFAQAEATQDELEEFKQNLAATSPERQQYIQDGYESVI